VTPAPDSPADVDTARIVLARLGVTVADLLESPTPTRQVPTFNEYLPTLIDAVPAGSLSVRLA